MNTLLLDAAKEQLANSRRLSKSAFTPPPMQAPQGMPPGAPPGAAPPGMPPEAPPGDPAAQGAPPAGMPPPGDPAAAGGAPPPAPPMDPTQDPLEQIRQMMKQEMDARFGQVQAGQAPAAAGGGASAGGGGSSGKGKANEQTAALAAMAKQNLQILKMLASLHTKSGLPMPEDLFDDSPALSDPSAQQPAAQPAQPQQKSATLADLGAAEAPMDEKVTAVRAMLRQIAG